MKYLAFILFPSLIFAQANVPMGSFPKATRVAATDLIPVSTNAASPSTRNITVNNLMTSMQALPGWVIPGNGLTNIVTPFDYGAIGDGVTDDTTAIQNWANALTSKDYLGFLAPAPGGFYKITSTITFTNTCRIFGAGGGKHTTSYPYTKSHIRMFTTATTALSFTFANDSLYLSGVAITAVTPGNFANVGCYGIVQSGGAGDMDCSIFDQVLVTNFNVGMYLHSCADTEVRGCSLGYNGVGVDAGGPVLNNLQINSCQMSYNYSNQIVAAGKVIILNTDIAAGAGVQPTAQGLYLKASTDVTLVSVRFEDYTTNSMIQAESGAIIDCIGVQFSDYLGSQLGKYAVQNTNGHLNFKSCSFNLGTSNGLSVFSHSTTAYSSIDSATPPVGEYVDVQGATPPGWTNYASISLAGRQFQTGTLGDASKRVNYLFSDPGATDTFHDSQLIAYANFTTMGWGGPVPINLYDYAYQKSNSMVLNKLFATNFTSPQAIFSTADYPNQNVTYNNTNAIYVMNSNSTFTLPPISTVAAGRTFTICSIPPANDVRINPNGNPDTIQYTSAYHLLITNQVCTVIADPGNTNWIVTSYTPTNTLPITEANVTGLVSDLVVRPTTNSSQSLTFTNPANIFGGDGSRLTGLSTQTYGHLFNIDTNALYTAGTDTTNFLGVITNGMGANRLTGVISVVTPGYYRVEMSYVNTAAGSTIISTRLYTNNVATYVYGASYPAQTPGGATYGGVIYLGSTATCTMRSDSTQGLDHATHLSLTLIQ